jgi:nicotinamidase-related amidase
MRVQKDESMGVIVDVQEKLFPVIHGKEQIQSNIQTLIKGLKTLNIPLVVTQQYTKGLGETIAPIKSLLKHFESVEKKAFSCCDEPEFMSKLHVFRKKYVIIAGIESHVCVLQTAIDLLDRQYSPVIVSDCIASRKEEDKNIAISRLISEGAIITSYESLLFELCRTTGTDEFKTISKYIKSK